MKNNEFIKLVHKDFIKCNEYITFGYQADYRAKENKDFGYVPFCYELEFEEICEIIPLTNPNNRCGVLKESTEFIVVHDTASGAPSADAKAHRNWLMSMATNPESKTCVSWHFTVDDHSIYQHLPTNEVGYHAGDGTRVKFEFIDTNVKANQNEKAEILIGEDGYYYVNGNKTNIEVPLDDDNNVPTNDQLPTLGINYKIGENGNYYISNTYFNSGYKKVANRGGNLNSVGIETCVNYGADYTKTMRVNAYLVAKLLCEFNLDIDRVKQHNSFSGKDCPMTIRHANRWDEFINLVEIYKYTMCELKGKKVTFESLSPEYLDKEGKVIKFEEGKEISYKVKIDDEEYVLTSKLAK